MHNKMKRQSVLDWASRFWQNRTHGLPGDPVFRSYELGLMRQDLEEAFAFLVGNRCDDILALVRNTITMHTQTTFESEIPIGVSRLGGWPDLPVGFEWPMNPAKEELSFVAQLNLCHAGPYEPEGILPTHGMLYVFYDAKNQPWGTGNQDGSRVVYYGGPQSWLVPTPRPGARDQVDWDMEGKQVPFRPLDFQAARVGFSSTVTLPGYGNPQLEQLALTEAELGMYFDIKAAHDSRAGLAYPDNRLLGWPGVFETRDMQSECEQEVPTGGRDWRLLLQIRSNSDLDMHWYDGCGTLYFWIPSTDLEKCNFDNVWVILESL